MKRKVRSVVNYPYGDGDSWRCRQLAKFLEERYAARQQDTTSQDLEIEPQNQLTLIDDLLFKILILVPAESLSRLQFVCKKWFDLINSSIFIRCAARKSETVLLCRKLTQLQPVRPQGGEEKPKSYFHFMDLESGGNSFMESSFTEEVDDIVASYDGLILARFGEYRELMIMNPVTRKHFVLPMGNRWIIISDSFGIAYSSKAKTYQIVHLFFDKFGRTGCEILCISTRKWRSIEAPPFELLRYMLSDTPVTVGESLYWTKRPCGFYLSMNLQDEKLVPKNFPVSCTAYWDKLLEIEGSLGFVHHAQLDQLQVWILMDEGGSRENWVKRYSFSLGVIDATYYMPICSSRNGKEMVIEGPDHKLYVYNFERGEMKLVHSRSDKEAWGGWIQKYHIPHRNTLVPCT